MGVQGLNPFLQKICPAVLKKLPNRLQDIQGKRIVIDGTLVTQRFHFAQGYESCKHVLGWYKLAKELDENGISAICVFDGMSRHLAKAREGERRREVRRLTALRESIESNRLQRLNKLKIVATYFQDFDADEKRSVAEGFRDVAPLPERASAVLQRQILQLTDRGSTPSLQEEEPLPPSPPSPPPPPLYPGSQTPPLDVPSPTIDSPFSIDETLHTFKSLSLNFKANLAKLASIVPSETPLPPTDEEENHIDCLMTKAQAQLTADEGKVWEDINASMSMYMNPAASPDFPSSTIDDIDMLADKSYMMKKSFQRRTNIPTTKTYQESKEILHAMGIPWIETTESVEAEALASAMVRQGLADFVATEDTDVLVYEVPMIKNITNRLEPLVVVSGAQVRAELDLDRDSFIDFALLLGTDFSQRIVNVGPTRAYKFIKDHGSIERIIEVETKFEPKVSREVYLAQVEIARLVFKTLPAVPSLKALKTAPKDDNKVIEVLERYGLSRALRKDGYSEYQTLLEGNYFGDNPSALR